jgi:hypothetical protein
MQRAIMRLLGVAVSGIFPTVGSLTATNGLAFENPSMVVLDAPHGSLLLFE